MAATVSLTTPLITAARARELDDAYTSATQAGGISVIFTRDEVDARARDLQAKLTALGVDDVSNEGQLVLGGSVEVTAGLRRGVSGLPTLSTTTELDLETLPAAFGYTHAGLRPVRTADTKVPRRRSTRTGRLVSASPSSPSPSSVLTGRALASGRTLVMTSASTLAVDEALIVAEHLQLQDGADLVIDSAVRYLTILAQRITVGADVTITWHDVGTPGRGALPAADNGTSFDPNTETSASAFTSPDGGDGWPGGTGERGFAGTDAPTVEIWGLDVTRLPELALRGGTGGTGGRGADGGNGGHGAKGLRSHSNAINCTRGPGFGGDGGDAGDGGDGGDGGTGGRGGDVILYLTDPSHEAVLGAGLTTNQSGGRGGDPGDGGTKGIVGLGGKAGDPTGFWCTAADERAGGPGRAGTDGGEGDEGDLGPTGTFTAIVITPDEFRTKWNSPQVRTVTPVEAEVRDTVTIEGANFTASSIVRIAGIAADTTFVADTILQAEVPAVPAGWVEVIVDIPGGESSNPGSLKVMPSLGAVSPSPAAVGTTITITGVGFDVGCRVLFRGLELDPDTVAADGGTLTVTLPAPRGPFEDLGGVEAISVRNPNGVATAPLEVELRHVLSTGFDVTRHGYSFTNSAIVGVANLDTFAETYGPVDVAAMFLLEPVLTGAWFAYYLHFFNDMKPGYSSGFSMTAADEYWTGNPDLFSDHNAIGDVEPLLTVAQGHILSEENLGALLLQAAAGVGRAETSLLEVEAAIRAQVLVPDQDFRRRSAPVLQLIPAGVPVLTAGFITGLSSSHGLMPIRVEYPASGDAWDKRLVVYDNAPGSGVAGTESRLVFTDSAFTFEHLDASGSVVAVDARDTANRWTLSHLSLEEAWLTPVSMPVAFVAVLSEVADVVVEGPPVPGPAARSRGQAGALHLGPLDGEVRITVAAEKAGTYTLAIVSHALGRSITLVDVPIVAGGRDVVEISDGLGEVVVRTRDEAKEVTLHYGVAGVHEARALAISGLRVGRRGNVVVHATDGLARFDVESELTTRPVDIRLTAANRADVADQRFAAVALGGTSVASFTVADWTTLGPDSLLPQG